MDAQGLLGVKVKSMQTVTVSYASLLDWIRRVFADPVQCSSLRFGLEDVGDNQVYTLFFISFQKTIVVFRFKNSTNLLLRTSI